MNVLDCRVRDWLRRTVSPLSSENTPNIHILKRENNVIGRQIRENLVSFETDNILKSFTSFY